MVNGIQHGVVAVPVAEVNRGSRVDESGHFARVSGRDRKPNCRSTGVEISFRFLFEIRAVLDQQIETIDLELRASWTPEGDHLERHLTAWSDMVCTFAGLPPVTEGVIPFNPHRRK